MLEDGDIFHNQRSYIYLEDNIVKIKQMNREPISLTEDKLILINELFFNLERNLFTIEIHGTSTNELDKKNKKRFNMCQTVELLNLKNNNALKSGFIIEYKTNKGDDAN